MPKARLESVLMLLALFEIKLKLNNIMELRELNLFNKVYENDFEDNVITLDLVTFEDMIRFRKWTQFRPIPNNYLVELLEFEYFGERFLNEFESEKRYGLHNVIGGTSSFIMALKKSNYDGEDYWEWICYIDNDQVYTYKEIAYIHEVQQLYYAITGEEIHVTQHKQIL